MLIENICSQYCDAAPAVQKCSSTEEVRTIFEHSIENAGDILNVQDIENVVHTGTPKVAYTSLQIFRGEIKIQSR